MGKTIPISRVGADHSLEKTMKADAEPVGIRKSGSGCMDGDDANLSRRVKKSDKDFRPQTPDQDFRKRIHGDGMSEEERGVTTEGGELIPKNTETSPGSEVRKGAGKHLFRNDGNLIPESQLSKSGFRPGRGQGAGRSQ